MKRWLVIVVLFCACPKPPPVPVPVPPKPLGPTEVWFCPNIGSKDLIQMFSNPDKWTLSRGKLKVWKWYSGELVSGCPNCGMNTLQNLVAAGAFLKLEGWGIEQAIEVPAIKEWGCTAAKTLPMVDLLVSTLQANGGTVSSLVSDEPIYASRFQINGKTCGMSYIQARDEYRLWLAALRVKYPTIKLGDIEQYPASSAQELSQWISDQPIDFFHLDIDWSKRNQPGFMDGIAQIKNAAKAKPVKFGVIFTELTSPTDAAYRVNTLEHLSTVMQKIGTPEQSVFQSWAYSQNYSVPINLTEQDLNSHTRILLDASSGNR